MSCDHDYIYHTFNQIKYLFLPTSTVLRVIDQKLAFLDLRSLSSGGSKAAQRLK